MSDLEQALAYFGAHFDGAAKTNRMGMVLQDEVLRLRAECKETRQERDAYCDELHKVRAELAQYATGRTMSCASCNEVVKELAQVEAESQVIIDRYNSCKAELAELKSSPMLKGLCQMKARAEKAESDLADLKKRMAHDEACSECPLKYDLGRAGEIIKVHESQVIGLESDLASAQTKIEAQSKRISWMAGDALKAKDDLAAAKAKYDEMHDARFAEARKVDALNADLSQARSECARKDEAIRSALDWLDTIHHRANDTYMRLSHALSKDDDWLSRQIAEARRPLVEVLQYARRMVRLDPDQVQQKIDEFLRGQEK